MTRGEKQRHRKKKILLFTIGNEYCVYTTIMNTVPHEYCMYIAVMVNIGKWYSNITDMNSDFYRKYKKKFSF